MRWSVVASLLVLAACASESRSTCDLESPPDAARVRATHGVDIASFPAVIPAGFTGCQRMWIGDQRDRRHMEPLATINYEAGRAVRMFGKEPGGPAYDCRYIAGTLDALTSVNPGRCPLSSAMEAFE